MSYPIGNGNGNGDGYGYGYGNGDGYGSKYEQLVELLNSK